MSIVIDDFGSYDQSGVETMLSIKEPLTCAVIPLVDNTTAHLDMLSKTNHEIILHTVTVMSCERKRNRTMAETSNGRGKSRKKVCETP